MNYITEIWHDSHSVQKGTEETGAKPPLSPKTAVSIIFSLDTCIISNMSIFKKIISVKSKCKEIKKNKFVLDDSKLSNLVRKDIIEFR